MSKQTVYCQCRLVKSIPTGELVQMSYIPERFARLGKVLRLRDDERTWSDGWRVQLVGNAIVEDDLDARTNASRHYRCTKDD